MFTNQVDEARNSFGVAMDQLYRFQREHGLGGTGYPQSFGNILLSFHTCEWLRPAPDGDSLPKLADTGVAKLLFEFRLAG
jgi:hypothetical protein